jgi:hypothetical protein
VITREYTPGVLTLVFALLAISTPLALRQLKLAPAAPVLACNRAVVLLQVRGPSLLALPVILTDTEWLVWKVQPSAVVMRREYVVF